MLGHLVYLSSPNIRILVILTHLKMNSMVQAQFGFLILAGRLYASKNLIVLSELV